MSAYYNEFEPYAAAWLRNLIERGLIADGEVDGRSIVDVRPDDLRDFTQCHFFAGIAGWSLAARLAGWPDDRPVWTGSCPCQPFSAAGKGKGVEDERHLWPELHRLIAECRPAVVFGEQVASKDGLGWLDAVHADLEASGYAVGAADLCAAGVGAPHIRQRLWFVGERLEYSARDGRQEWRPEPSGRGLVSGCSDERMADAASSGSWTGLRGHGSTGQRRHLAADGIGPGGLGHDHDTRLEGQRSGHQAEGGWLGAVRSVAPAGEPRGMADDYENGRKQFGEARLHGEGQSWDNAVGRGKDDRPRPTNGHWRDADWLFCRDGKFRPVEPGTFPLVNGAPARVGRLRAYGNAIVPQVAAEVIAAFMECRP